MKKFSSKMGGSFLRGSYYKIPVYITPLPSVLRAINKNVVRMTVRTRGSRVTSMNQ